MPYDPNVTDKNSKTKEINDARAKIRREMRRHAEHAQNGRLTETLRATHHGAAEACHMALAVFPIGDEDEEEPAVAYNVDLMKDGASYKAPK